MFFLCPRRFLYVLLLAFAGFSLVFCARGDICMCFCWLLLAFLGFFASAAIFVCAFVGFCWLFLGFLGFFASAAIFVCAFAGFSWVFGVRGDFCMCFCWLLLAFLGFFASAAIFVCAFAGFCWLLLEIRQRLVEAGAQNSGPGGDLVIHDSRSEGDQGEPTGRTLTAC